MRYVLIFSLLVLSHARAAESPAIPDAAAIRARVARAMQTTGARGLAMAVIDQGKVVFVDSFGVRNAAGDPLQTDTIMYGASLTKLVAAYVALQLVDGGQLDLDRPVAAILKKPLPDYGNAKGYADFSALSDDARWRAITPRIVLTHGTGFANFGSLEPDRKLHIHFDPGTRYAYSGDGIVLLQFGIEQGLGLDFGRLTASLFDHLGMTRSSLVWRDDFAGNLADGWDDQGQAVPHDQRSRVRAAGSLDTTITDFAKFAAAVVRGDGLTAASRAELARPQLHITTAHQFPTLLLPPLPPEQQRADLSAGLGVVTFTGPQGPGFYKGGHNEITANTCVFLEHGQRAVVILSNDVRTEAAFAELVAFILGQTGMPYDWEYGDRAGKS